MAPERDITSQDENSSTPVMSVPASPVAGIPDQNAQSAISILLAVAQSQSRNDDDLTSLNWLHEHDLLKGMNINPSPSNSVSSNSLENYDNDKTLAGRFPRECQEVSDSTSCYLNSISACPNQTRAAPRNKHPHSIPYDPSVHTDNKPPYSFSCLIFMAIEDSHEKALPVKEIYAWIVNHFPYFKKAPLGWKNSVRHNLSLNKCFQKVEKATNLGKGSLWTIDPKYKPTLIQALNRSTFNNSPSLLEFSVNKSSASHSPDPDLFPFLSRELAVNGISKLNGKDQSESLEAVDAAAVMLSLKNGTRHKNFRERAPVVMTSPSQDHTYSSADNVIFIKEEHEDAGHIDFRSPTSNCTCRKLTFEDDEDKKIKEGAETLLNLAGVTLKRTHLDLNDASAESPKKMKYPQFDINKNETQEVISATSRLPRAKKRENMKIFVSNDGELVDCRQEVIYKKYR